MWWTSEYMMVGVVFMDTIRLVLTEPLMGLPRKPMGTFPTLVAIG